MDDVNKIFHYYSLAEVIAFLKNRNFSRFYCNPNASINTNETEEIYVHGVSHHEIPEETVRRMLDVLENLQEYLKKAYDRLLKLNLENDEHFDDNDKKLLSDEPERVFTLSGIEFGIINANTDHPHYTLYKPLCWGHKPKKDTDGFLLTIDAGRMFFDVMFAYEDMCPYAIKAWV